MHFRGGEAILYLTDGPTEVILGSEPDYERFLKLYSLLDVLRSRGEHLARLDLRLESASGVLINSPISVKE